MLNPQRTNLLLTRTVQKCKRSHRVRQQHAWMFVHTASPHRRTCRQVHHLVAPNTQDADDFKKTEPPPQHRSKLLACHSNCAHSLAIRLKAWTFNTKCLQLQMVSTLCDQVIHKEGQKLSSLAHESSPSGSCTEGGFRIC